MHLKNWFNYKYLLQNLKKSKSLLALLVGLLPLINTLMLLFYASSVRIEIATLTNISWLNYVGVYAYPVVLAIALLGYTFKKKQVDFIGSMPINRKTIFTTNVIGGIIILTSIMVLNVIIIAIVSLFYPNFIIAPALLWDYFIFWTISYIFVFVVATLATTIASNMVTTLVVTALILFLFPFVHDYIYKVTAFANNYTFENIVRRSDNYYTVPYNIIANAFRASIASYNIISILKMIGLSIVYFGIGLYSFTRKRLEVSETSFKNFHTHTIVKCLTMIPLGFIFYEGCVNRIGFLGLSLLIALMLAYYFIYDLITKKQINNVLISLIYFFGLVMLTLFIGTQADDYQKYLYNKSTEMITDNIKAINIRIDEYYYSQENRLEQVYTTDSQVIDYFIDLYNNRGKAPANDQNFIDFKIIDNEENKFAIKLIANTEDYNKIISTYLNTKELKKEYEKINNHNIILAEIDNQRIDKKEFVDLLSDVIKKADTEQIFKLFSNEYSGFPVVNLYMYDNHKVASYTINPNASIELMNYLYNKHHSELKNYLKKNKTNNNLFIRTVSKIPELNYETGYLSSVDYEISKFIVDHINDEVDFSKPYFVVTLDSNKNTYYFYSNAIEEFAKIYHGDSKGIVIDTFNGERIYDY